MTIRYFCDLCHADLGERQVKLRYETVDCNKDPVVRVETLRDHHYCKECLAREAYAAVMGVYPPPRNVELKIKPLNLPPMGLPPSFSDPYNSGLGWYIVTWKKIDYDKETTLPARGDRVIVYGVQKRVFIARWWPDVGQGFGGIRKCWISDNDRITVDPEEITHWMRLPGEAK